MAQVIQGSFYVSQAYGCTDYTGEWAVGWCPSGHFHCGVDLGANCGLPVLAPRAGRVYAKGDQYLGPDAIGLDIGGGIFLAFGHLNDSVGIGTEVHAGEVIGHVGTKGVSTGCHLHLRAATVRLPLESPNNTIDPAPYIEVVGGFLDMLSDAEQRMLYDKVNLLWQQLSVDPVKKIRMNAGDAIVDTHEWVYAIHEAVVPKK